jgi:hypothetical protein
MPSRKVTVPVGVPPLEVTLAVSVTGVVVVTLVVGEMVSVVVVAAGGPATVRATAEDVLEEKPEVPG